METTTANKTMVTVTLLAGWFSVRCDYSPRMVAGIKSIGGKWDAQGRRWLVRDSKCAALYSGLVSLYGANTISWCGNE